jgi:hypothetical protein
MFLSASAWSILLRAMTVGNFSSVKAVTSFSTVSGGHVSSGVLICARSRARATT